MGPATYALELYRGDYRAWRFDFYDDEAKTEPTDFTGAMAEAEIRNRSGGDVIMTLDCIIDANQITVTLSPDEWDNWTAGRTGGWDLQVTYSGGEVVTYVAGPVEIDGDFTESELLGSSSSYPLSRVN